MRPDSNIIKELFFGKSEYPEYFAMPDTETKIDYLLAVMRNKTDVQHIMWIRRGFISLLSLVIIFYCFKAHQFYPLIILPLIALYTIVRRKKFKAAILDAKKMHTIYYEGMQEKDYINSRINYLIQGLRVKKTRIGGLKWLLFLFFPWLLILLFKLFTNDLNGQPLLGSIVLSYMLSSLTWWFFFKNELDEMDMIEGDLATLIIKDE